MSHQPDGLNKLGGFSFIISGVLFLVKYLLDLATGPPPSSGAEILAWVTAKKLPLEWVSEILFFAGGFLIPAIIALYRSLAGVEGAKAAAGCGLIAAAIPTLFMTLIVHGRLVYPIYGLEVSTPEAAEIVVSLFYGGMHAVLLLFGIGTMVLSLAMGRGGYGRSVAALGLATGVFDIASSYPDRIGPVLTLIGQVLFAAWFFAVGWKLSRMGRQHVE